MNRIEGKRITWMALRGTRPQLVARGRAEPPRQLFRRSQRAVHRRPSPFWPRPSIEGRPACRDRRGQGATKARPGQNPSTCAAPPTVPLVDGAGCLVAARLAVAEPREARWRLAALLDICEHELSVMSRSGGVRLAGVLQNLTMLCAEMVSALAAIPAEHDPLPPAGSGRQLPPHRRRCGEVGTDSGMTGSQGGRYSIFKGVRTGRFPDDRC